MDIKYKDQNLKIQFDSSVVNVIISDLSLEVDFGEKRLSSPGEYEINGVHLEIMTNEGFGFDKVAICNVSTKNNKKVTVVKNTKKLDKDNLAILSNSDIIICELDFALQNNSLFSKFNPSYVLGLSSQDRNDEFQKIFSVDSSNIVDSMKIDDKSLNDDSEHTTKFILLK
jgi:hypothetical protein